MRGPIMPNSESRHPVLTAAMRLLPILFLLLASGVAWADTGYCPAPYCGTGRPDPWPGDVPLPNEQLLAAYVARYNCPVGVQPCRCGYSAELLTVNYIGLENQCRAGQMGSVLGIATPDQKAIAARVKAANDALPKVYRDGIAEIDAKLAAGLLSEADYMAKRTALQGLVPRSKAGGAHDCLATTTEVTDSSFGHCRQGDWARKWWWEYNDGGRPDNPVIVHDTTRACGPYSTTGPIGYPTYWNNTPPCGVPAPRCGDGHADPGETCSTCPADLGPCPPPPPPPDLALRLGPAGRFKVEATWTTPATPTSPSRTGPAKPIVVKANGGAFTLFDPERPELYVTAVEGCPVNGRWWIFAAGLTNVEIHIVTTDTKTGAKLTIANPQGQTFGTTLDTDAFSCP